MMARPEEFEPPRPRDHTHSPQEPTNVRHCDVHTPRQNPGSLLVSSALVYFLFRVQFQRWRIGVGTVDIAGATRGNLCQTAFSRANPRQGRQLPCNRSPGKGRSRIKLWRWPCAEISARCADYATGRAGLEPAAQDTWRRLYSSRRLLTLWGCLLGWAKHTKT